MAKLRARVAGEGQSAGGKKPSAMVATLIIVNVCDDGVGVHHESYAAQVELRAMIREILDGGFSATWVVNVVKRCMECTLLGMT